jgi:hypothetical protein
VKNRVGIRVYKIWREGGGERGVLELGEEEREWVPPERAVDGTGARHWKRSRAWRAKTLSEKNDRKKKGFV